MRNHKYSLRVFSTQLCDYIMGLGFNRNTMGDIRFCIDSETINDAKDEFNKKYDAIKALGFSGVICLYEDNAIIHSLRI